LVIGGDSRRCVTALFRRSGFSIPRGRGTTNIQIINRIYKTCLTLGLPLGFLGAWFHSTASHVEGGVFTGIELKQVWWPAARANDHVMANRVHNNSSSLGHVMKTLPSNRKLRTFLSFDYLTTTGIWGIKTISLCNHRISPIA
jgi:hypothetical protein